MEPVAAIQNMNIIRHILPDDGQFPNNGLLPLLIYQKAVTDGQIQSARLTIELLETNGWVNAWENGVYDYHHYHSMAHEVLVIIEGSARLQFGGPTGVALLVEVGDTVIIPAGVAHKAIDLYDNFKCVGAYPLGQEYDIKKGEEGERDEAIRNIKSVPLPSTDPIFGIDGPLLHNWKY
jgi:uncharacterized protein YjlB